MDGSGFFGIFDRPAVTLIIGLLIGVWLELWRDSRQRVRDREQRWFDSQRTAIAELQVALLEVHAGVWRVATYVRKLDESNGESTEIPVEAEWHRELIAANNRVTILATRITDPELIRHVGEYVALIQEVVGDVPDRVEAFDSVKSELNAALVQANRRAGRLIQDIGAPEKHPYYRQWLMEREQLSTSTPSDT